MPVWRYLSFDKFLNFLMHREIQFTRASLFSDQNEVSLLQPRKGRAQLSTIQAEELDEHIRKLRGTTFVSCWSLGVSESYPLWKIYLGGSRNGVAIRTTVGRLRASLSPSAVNFFDAGVEYRKTVFEEMPADEQLICTKVEAYAYEREFRVFTHDSKHFMDNALVPNVVSEAVDVGTMLRYVYVSPFSSPWFESTVKEIMQRLAPDLKVPIRKSTIRDV